MIAISESLRHSKAVQFVTAQGWNWRPGSGDQIQVEICPYCKKSDFKFFMGTGDPNDPRNTRDGLHKCFHSSCDRQGNLRTLAEHLGLRIPGVDSRKEWASNGEHKPDALPDTEACHQTLLGDPEAMDYLLNVRGFTREIIDQQKLGLKEKIWFHEVGESKALVIPYLVGGNIVFAKYRTLPPKPKDFITPSGWEAPLYNGEILVEGINEVLFVEGEADALSCLSQGISYVVGVPGANVKKTLWIDTLDKVAPKKIYILYDADKAGRKGAQELASRIGIEKCYKITLPLFNVTVDGITRPGKDINDWFRYGEGTLEKFEDLKKQASLFDITGVTSSVDALTQLENELNEKTDLAPTYVFPWPELNKLIGMEKGDVLDIVAPEKVGKTTFGLNILDHMVSQYGENGLLVCLEMTQARLAKKWVSLVTGFEDVMTEPGTEPAKQKLAELKAACVTARSIQQERAADLYFAYPQLVSEPEDIFKLMRDCIRRYGVEWIMFDNLQRLCDDTLKNQGHRTVQLSQISKGLAKLTKDYNIKMIRILQPKRIEKGATISTNDVDGSSQVAKDCDGMITMWRRVVGELKKSEWETEQEGFTESLESFDPITKITVGLSRYSAGGTTKLLFDGARSQVRSIPNEQKAGMKQNVEYNKVIPLEGGGTIKLLPMEETVNI